MPGLGASAGLSLSLFASSSFLAPKRFGMLGQDGAVVLLAGVVDAAAAAGASGFFPNIPPPKSPPPVCAAGVVDVAPTSAGFGGAEKKLDGVDPLDGVA